MRYCGKTGGGRCRPRSSCLQLEPLVIADTRVAQELRGHQAICSSASHTLRAPIPPPLVEEQGLQGALLGGAGDLEYVGALLRSKNPAFATLGGSQCTLERACAASQPPKSPPPGAAEPDRILSHIEPLVPTLKPIAHRLVSGLHLAETQATDTPIPGAGTQVSSAEKGFYE